MEVYNNVVCISKPELTAGVSGAEKLKDRQVMSDAAYDSYIKRNPNIRLRLGKGKGCPALLAIDLLRADLKALVIAKYGDPTKLARKGGLLGVYVEDVKAAEYFAGYRFADDKKIASERVREYTANASMLNAVARLINTRKILRKAMGNGTKGIWEHIAVEVADLQDEYKHTLPENHRRLREKVAQYIAGGYDVLISKMHGNVNRLKVHDKLEKLILSLYCLPEKPYVSTVLEMYLQFLAGVIDVVAVESGELFDRADFYDGDGLPLVVSEKTVWNYINNPKNRAIVDKHRNDQDYFTHKVRPHHFREAPEYSFSKISLDDRDLPRKMANGARVKAYYAYDVYSGAIIGRAYAQSKNKELFIDCIRDMFHFLDQNNYGIPLEMEVEHHLVNKYKNDLMKAGTVFPLVRWCNAGNSQEKYAEPMNRVKKYGYEKRYQTGIGRFYARLEANRPPQTKIFDEENNNYKEKVYTYNELVADDLDMVAKYNNAPHPDKEKHKGMSRMDVLRANPNPALAHYDKSFVAQYIGEKVESSVKRNSSITVQYEEFQLPDPSILARMQGKNVDAYYLPQADGEIDEIYVYQAGRYICTCKQVDRYNRARAEWKDEDQAAFDKQAAYVAAFDKMSKEKKVQKVRVIETGTMRELEQAECKIVDVMTPDRDFWDEEGDTDDLYNYSPEVIRERARNDF